MRLADGVNIVSMALVPREEAQEDENADSASAEEAPETDVNTPTSEESSTDIAPEE